MKLTNKEIEYVRQNLSLKTWPALGKDLNLNAESLRKACYKLGINKHSHRGWSNEHNTFLLTQLSNGSSPSEIADQLGRTIASINSHITTLGLRKSREVNISPEEAPYIAGYLEADGCFSFRVEIKGHRAMVISPVISVSSTNINVCKWFKERFGGQIKIKTQYKFEANWNNVHSYSISDTSLVREILRRIKPHLRFKREQAIQLEQFCEGYSSKGTFTKALLELVIANRRLNSGGNNERSKENTAALLKLINEL